MNESARVIEALLFLSPEPLGVGDLADATGLAEAEVLGSLAELGDRFASGDAGIVLRELAGGFTLASDPIAEEAARRLFGRETRPTLTQAQAETLAIVAYLQPVSRPEIARIRGVSADWAVTALQERDLVEESGRSQFGATLYRTTTAFLRYFGLRSIEELPDVSTWDPTPEEAGELRERLLRAGEARAGAGATELGGTAPLDLEAENAAAYEQAASVLPKRAHDGDAGAGEDAPREEGPAEQGLDDDDLDAEAFEEVDGDDEADAGPGGELQVDRWEHELLMDP